MCRVFKEYLLSIANISEEVIDRVLDISNLKNLSKGESLISQDKPYTHEVFIIDGVVRSYFIDEDGNDNTVCFYSDKSFLGTNTLRNKGVESIYTYQALTRLSYLEINSNLFYELMKLYPILEKVVYYVKQRESNRSHHRDKCILGTSSIQKYNNFLKYYPDLIDIIPHYHIASFLGMTPVTLSRIRNKKYSH